MTFGFFRFLALFLAPALFEAEFSSFGEFAFEFEAAVGGIGISKSLDRLDDDFDSEEGGGFSEPGGKGSPPGL